MRWIVLVAWVMGGLLVGLAGWAPPAAKKSCVHQARSLYQEGWHGLWGSLQQEVCRYYRMQKRGGYVFGEGRASGTFSEAFRTARQQAYQTFLAHILESTRGNLRPDEQKLLLEEQARQILAQRMAASEPVVAAVRERDLARNPAQVDVWLVYAFPSQTLEEIARQTLYMFLRMRARSLEEELDRLEQEAFPDEE